MTSLKKEKNLVSIRGVV